MKDKSSDSASDKDDDDENKDDDTKAKPLQLVIRNLLDGKSTTYDNVVRYQFSKNGKQLVLLQKNRKKNLKKEGRKKIHWKINLWLKKIRINPNLRNIRFRQFRLLILKPETSIKSQKWKEISHSLHLMKKEIS
jgi:hypothetical protein